MARQCIGLDIGSSSVKLVQVKLSRKGMSLQNFGIEPLPTAAIIDGTIGDPNAVAEAIRNLAKRIHLRGKDVAFAVSGNSVIIRRLQIPAMEGAALAEQMEWEVRQNVPFARDEVIVDWEVLVERTPEGQMEVVLVAAKREVVEQYMQVVRAAGFNPVVVDTDAFAMQNAIDSVDGLVSGETVAVINVGAHFSTISIVRDGKPVFHRNLSSGGDTFTEAIRHRLAVSQDGAEAYKVGSAAGAGAGSAADVVPQEVHRVLAQVSEQVSAEFQRSIDFYVNDAVDANLARVYLTGGSALVPQLPKAIQDRSGVPVMIFDPFSKMSVDARRFDVEYLRANAPVASVALGLALRAPGDK
ncbi:type IV pilus assembly protein PilM [Pseudenhygromyxa sp. WMMC2535]|uniref:type IV pilus assembly protein PilM n=1 Tax=Pseudenhygromyxa sp. WMMC2535 TaxID=2712867 RepID=UPI001556A44B|nr:type IV pilus assembly protein PilM [Pseudenhygromyxa sp. WMMC2535]NVB38280.1 type IV pilus assembly protein PilM [Pseudenhygromyxa sp. WMMC2535]